MTDLNCLATWLIIAALVAPVLWAALAVARNSKRD